MTRIMWTRARSECLPGPENYSYAVRLAADLRAADLRTGPQFAHLWWPASCRQPASVPIAQAVAPRSQRAIA